MYVYFDAIDPHGNLTALTPLRGRDCLDRIREYHKAGYTAIVIGLTGFTWWGPAKEEPCLAS